MNRRPLSRTRTRRPLGTPEFLDHGFLDPRSYVETRTGRVVLFGADKTKLRRDVYARAQGKCEIEWDGKRCGKFAAWDGIGKGELVHIRGAAFKRNDTLEHTQWGCRECHSRRDHPGPQFVSERRRRGDVVHDLPESESRHAADFARD